MKRVLEHPTAEPGERKYWRGFGELDDTPEFRGWLEKEFPQGAAELEMDGVSRRNFLKLMGASAALAGLVGCRRPVKHLVPFTHSVEWTIPGKPLFYTTSMPQRLGAVPLIVQAIDGRPIKVEGNHLHPLGGGTDAFAQASILDLYDPERSRFFREKGEKRDEAAFEKYLDEALAKAGGGEGMAILVEPGNSPTRERLRGEIEKKFPQAKWCVYEPLAATDGAEAAFGTGVSVTPDISKADVILSLGSDFLGNAEGTLATMRSFANRRRVEQPSDDMNRLYVVESHFTITGGMADHRLRCPASQIGAVAAEIARQLGSGDAASQRFTAGAPAQKLTPEMMAWIAPMVADLKKASGKVLVLVGSRQPAAVQMLGHAINSALGGNGATTRGSQSGSKPGMSIIALAEAVAAKQIQTLFILGGNPAYNAPADLEWANLQAQVPEVIRLSLYEDETTRTVNGDDTRHVAWHIPQAHYLESWGDGRAADGSYLSMQPMILPLYGGWSELDLLARIAGLPKTDGPELIQETFRGIASGGADFKTAWNQFLHDGFLADSAPEERTLSFNADSAAAASGAGDPPAAAPTADAMEVVFIADSRMDDGRYANNGWLQELPDPVTKLTWDNAALISVATARHLGIKAREVQADMLEIEIDGRKIEIPALVAPGTADFSIGLPMGYGRSGLGWVSEGSGTSVYPLRTAKNPYFATGAKVRKIGRTYPLAITQQHHSMEGRAIVREGTLERYRENPQFARKEGMDAHTPPNFSLYSNPPLEGPHQWGMAVDLNVCTGCSACVIACQAENNSPIVGKEQVINGREMHWIRADRYFAGDDTAADPEMVMQPMMCQHCENAPCETVCPVNATVHSVEGLNVMAYNRCIGTRYCANNCPFKVRRFNFFDYNQRPVGEVKIGPIKASGLLFGPLTEKGMATTLKMRQNPNVTVRMRGVMEKCTFCVQRIQEAKIATKVRAGGSDDVVIPTDSFTSACAQACPTDAIVFGNIADPGSKVSQVREREQKYRVLEYLNVGPRVTYLARLRNPNPAMPGAEKVGRASQEGDANYGGGVPIVPTYGL